MDGKTLKSIEDKITETIDKYITPSVSMHGGKIELLSYDKEDKPVSYTHLTLPTILRV